MALGESDRKRFPAAAEEVGKWRDQVRQISEGRDRAADEAKRHGLLPLSSCGARKRG